MSWVWVSLGSHHDGDSGGEDVPGLATSEEAWRFDGMRVAVAGVGTDLRPAGILPVITILKIGCELARAGITLIYFLGQRLCHNGFDGPRQVSTLSVAKTARDR